MDKYLKRTWAEIDLDAAEYNYHAIRSALHPGIKMCCVVKADAYGHGSEVLARLYEKLGADWLAVSNLEEAIQLRNEKVHLPILILGYTPPKMAGQLCALNISQALLSEEYAEALNQEAVRQGTTVRCHIKLDTGMSRIGFVYQQPFRDGASLDAIERVCNLQGLIHEGIFTHFAVADEGEAGRAFTEHQFACFSGAIKELEKRGVTFQLHHCDNSAGVTEYPQMQLDMCRPGVILYGMQPSAALQNPLQLKPVMALKSVISLVKTLEPDTPLSYGCTCRTQQKTVVATGPIGYADGYPRMLSNQGEVLVHGHRAKILGRVCMDQLMIDVTGIENVHADDEVTLIGCEGEESISAAEIAGLCKTINYEITCDINKRVSRVYLRNGKPVSVTNLIC